MGRTAGILDRSPKLVMTTQNPFSGIEDQSFRFDLGVESGSATFVGAMVHHPSYVSVLAELREPEEQAYALSRLRQLANVAVDPRYRNPDDITLAAYTLSIASAVPELAGLAAGIASEAHNTWWCAMIVDQVIMEYTSKAEAGSDTLEISALGIRSGQRNDPMVRFATTFAGVGGADLDFVAPHRELADARNTSGASDLEFRRLSGLDWVRGTEPTVLTATVRETSDGSGDL